MTPRQFDALLKRHREQIEHQELLNGILASVIVNFSLGAPKVGKAPVDFMPSQWRKKVEKQPRKPRVNRQSINNSIRGFLQGQLIARQKG